MTWRHAAGMARTPRIDLPCIPQHVAQCGNNRLPCFLDDGDRLRYLQLLRKAVLATGVELHAYMLMDNHVHMLATPRATGDVARMMQKLGRQYVGMFDARHGHTGTLWEGRYKACMVDNEHDVLTCQRYIELNPVRACATDDPADRRRRMKAGDACRCETPRPSIPHPLLQKRGRTDGD